MNQVQTKLSLMSDNRMFNCIVLFSDSKGKAGKVGKRAYLEKLVNDTIDLADDESAYRVYFDWDDEISVPGAILIRNEHNTEFFLKSINLKDIPDHGNVHFLCSSWVYPLKYYEKDRIFFSNKVISNDFLFIYLGVSTINLSFWLSSFLNMVLEPV